jgi:hypothetical protein
VALDQTNSTPPDNIRLPDALTVRHGSGPLIGRIVLEGDIAARRAGIRLYFRSDFDALLELNRRQSKLGHWHKLLGTFDPEGTDISGENGFWIAGHNEAGEIVTCSAGRIYHWPDSTLEPHAAEVFFGRDEGQPRTVTAPAAKFITGTVMKAGSTWVHPDYRGRELSHLMPRLARAYALGHWPLDWIIGYVPKVLIDKGIAAGYGVKHVSYSILFPESPHGEIGLTYTSGQEVYDDFGSFIADELSDPAIRKFAPAPLGAALGKSLVHEVTSTASEPVRQGSSSRSN